MKDSTPAKVLIVDDQPEVAQIIKRWLGADGLDCEVAFDGQDALALLKTGRYSIVIADIMMTGLTALDMLGLINTLSLDVSAIMVAAASDGELARACMGLGAYAYVTKPLDKDELIAQVKGALVNRALAPLLDDPGDLAEQTLSVGTREFSGFRDFHSREEEVVLRLLSCCGFRNGEDQGHLRRVGVCSAKLARALGWEKSAVEDIRVAAAMHDIGKFGIPTAILNKPAKLNLQEMIVFRKHPIVGSLILGGSKIPMLRMAHDIALYHHERWDGSGYPAGLSGETIPHPARLVAVVDVFDALLHERRCRAQRPPVSEHHAIALMVRKKGSHFDPMVLECFVEMIPEIRQVHEDFKDKGDISEMYRSIMDELPQA